MKQRKQKTSVRPANDNHPSHAEAKNMAHGQDVAHLYVQEAEKHEPENMGNARARGTWRPTRIYTNLPENLPILPEEIALIQGFMGDLVSAIIANDNEPL